ncbi:PREDICTED: serine/threonine-protein kinase ULK3 isoform X1 [Myotis brandtii]|uniref:serine/threonine-protein kinase ULK3 isoform X1 n=3 Tax=Myotis brandtii TaxID=109478 RepID=UPI000703EFCB|nr:PREDICTED: serine/threonine-protein kinase ULK3 isoform X1 [Myotis brandtii]
MAGSSWGPPRLDGFILTERLGSGTYATVYKAYAKKDTREVVAIKCVAKKSLNKASVENLLTEIEILKGIRHPHIVQLKDFQWDSDNIYLIMEFCAGGDLSRFIHTRRILPEKVARVFMQQIASALQFLHARNISHLDLKPQNILLSSLEKPHLKLADFGFSQHMSPWDEKHVLRGSPLYMAPEMVCQRQYDARVDLWSVGVILYEALFGQPPFASRSFTELEEKIRSNRVIEVGPAGPQQPVVGQREAEPSGWRPHYPCTDSGVGSRYLVLGVLEAPFSSRDLDQPTDCVDPGPVFPKASAWEGRTRIRILRQLRAPGRAWAGAWAGGLALYCLHHPDVSLFLLALRFSTCQTCTSGTYQDRVGEVLEPSVTCPPPSPQLPLRPQLSPDCQDLLRRLLERDPGRRISFQDFFAHPWVDLDHMPSEESLARATILVVQAVKKDQEGDAAAALSLYCKALDFFVPALHYEVDAQRKEAIKAKVRQYVSRAEELKAIVSSSNQALLRQGASAQDLLREMARDKPRLLAALEVASAAVAKEEEAGGEQDALDLYQHSLGELLLLLAGEPPGRRRELLHTEVQNLMARAEYLKEQVKMRESHWEAETLDKEGLLESVRTSCTLQ